MHATHHPALLCLSPSTRHAGSSERHLCRIAACLNGSAPPLSGSARCACCAAQGAWCRAGPTQAACWRASGRRPAGRCSGGRALLLCSAEGACCARPNAPRSPPLRSAWPASRRCCCWPAWASACPTTQAWGHCSWDQCRRIEERFMVLGNDTASLTCTESHADMWPASAVFS